MSQRKVRKKLRQKKEEERGLRIMGAVFGVALLIFFGFVLFR